MGIIDFNGDGRITRGDIEARKKSLKNQNPNQYLEILENEVREKLSDNNLSQREKGMLQNYLKRLVYSQRSHQNNIKEVQTNQRQNLDLELRSNPLEDNRISLGDQDEIPPIQKSELFRDIDILSSNKRLRDLINANVALIKSMQKGLSPEIVKREAEQGGWTNRIDHGNWAHLIKGTLDSYGVSPVISTAISSSIMYMKEATLDVNITMDDVPIPFRIDGKNWTLILTPTLGKSLDIQFIIEW